MAPLTDTHVAPVPFVVENKSWPELLHHVRYWRSRSRKAFANNWSQLSVVGAMDGSGRARLYGLGSPGRAANASHQTLLYADVEVEAAAGGEVRWKELLEDEEHHRERRALSKEEEALHERLRASIVSGVSHYTLDDRTRDILFVSASRLFLCNDASFGSQLKPRTLAIHLPAGGSPLHPQQCFADPSLLAFVCSGDIYLHHGSTTTRATFTGPNTGQSAGSPSFVMQEEFDRYSAMWWSPKKSEDGKAFLLYEFVDESDVVELTLSAPGTLFEAADSMRYPLAGTNNAVSSLKMLQVSHAPAGGVSITDLYLWTDVRAQLPWFEYLLRAGWMPNGEAVWALLLSRKQDQLALIYIPRSLFVDPKAVDQPNGAIIVLYEDRSDIWVNAHNLTHFLSTNDPTIARFIFSTEKHGYSHLYLVEKKLDNEASTPVSEIAITGGQWPVIRNAGIIVDEIRGHVYFVAHKNSPLEASICVASYRSPGECRLLTTPGKSYRSDRVDQRLHVTPDVGFVCWESSICEPPVCVFYRLLHPVDGSLPTAVPLCRVGAPEPRMQTLDDVLTSMTREESIESIDVDDPSLGADNDSSSDAIFIDIPYEKDVVPEIIEYMSANSGKTQYALLMRPNNWQPNTAYPVLHYVYAGPGIQLVRNVWSSWGGFQKYTSLGYAVLMVDGRGSSNRGLEFEAALKCRMGTIEVDDQVEGLRAVAAQTGSLLDLSRVAIFGWSYGGYVSLLALAQRPDVYKVCVAGGPVSSWTLYDTGYTERYMGLPREQPIAYSAGSVLHQAYKFPSEPDRLLILHGLIDENVHFRHTEKLIDALIKAGKPYRLQVFPRERHGVRSNEANEVMDATVLQLVGVRLGAPSANSKSTTGVMR
uniref:Dipeptidyl peptidase 9 n=1 Tax=Plectus sambesii TaxID=2011161 RepID=A0A914VL41_9BILA